MKDQFSVLMSCYFHDNPEYLNQSILSTLNSSTPPNEFIIVVDGEIPDTINNVLLTHSNNPVIKIERLNENVGLGSALKYGLEKCTNDLVARMDSDDINEPERFKLQLNEFKKDKKLDICGTYIKEFSDTDSELQLLRKVPLSNSEIKKFSRFRSPINHVSVMFRRSKILQVGSYEKMLSFEDYFLWLKCIDNNFKIKNIPVVGVNVRGGVEMIKRRSGMKYIFNEINFLLFCYKRGFLNLFLLMLNVILKIPLRIFGQYLGKIYIVFLRTKVT